MRGLGFTLSGLVASLLNALVLAQGCTGQEPAPDPAALPPSPALQPGAAGDSLLEAGQLLARRGAHRAAEDLFRQALQRDPQRIPAYAGLAYTLLKTAQFHQAAQVCTTGLAQDSTAVSLYNILSAAYAGEGRYALAMQALEKALAHQPDFALGWLNLGGIHTRLGEYEEATLLLARALALAPGDPVVRRRRGELFLQTDQPDSAIAEFAAALQADPDSETLYYLHGKALEASGQLPQALEAYTQARRRDPGFSEAHYRAAVLARRQQRPALADSAMRDYDHLQALGRQDLTLLQKYTLLRASLLDSPEDPLHHFQLALFFSQQGYDREALNRFARVLQLCPEDYHALNHLGSILLRNRNPGEALGFFDQALRLAPDFAPALVNAGNASMLLRRPQAAARYYRRAVELAPGAAMAWHQLARAYLALDQPQEAERALRSGLAAKGADPGVVQAMEELLRQLGKTHQ